MSELIDEVTLKKWREALSTQYQLHGDYSITPRASKDAPTIEQLSAIREAHRHVLQLVDMGLHYWNEGNES